MGPIYAKCNKSCGHRWYVKHFANTKLSGTVEKISFTCPNCKREYVGYYTDQHVRELQGKMRELLRRMKWADGEELQQLVQQTTNLKATIKQCMDKLKERYNEQQTFTSM